MKKLLITLALIYLCPALCLAAEVILEDDSKMDMAYISDQTVDDSTHNCGAANYIRVGVRYGAAHTVFNYDTTFTENITAGTLFVVVDVVAFMGADDDTLEIEIGQLERVIYEGNNDPCATADDGEMKWHDFYSLASGDSAWSTEGGLGTGDTTGVVVRHEEWTYSPTNYPAVDDTVAFALPVNGATEWPPTGTEGFIMYPYNGKGNNYFAFNSEDYATAEFRPWIKIVYGDGGVVKKLGDVKLGESKW